MFEESIIKKEKVKRRTLGVHLTSTDIFLSYIFPVIKDRLYDYLWVDLYAGEGNLILPILEHVPEEKRIDFFKKHIFLSDVQPAMVTKSIENANKYGISSDIAEKNIIIRNNLESFPNFLLKRNLSIFHITNPPYLYLGYIRKHKQTEIHLKLFEKENGGYQDLYQIAMINDLRAGVRNLIYIIPSNFLYGAAISNKFRIDFLSYYKISKMYIFETQIFEFTGTNICIAFFDRKRKPRTDIIEFEGIKILKNEKILKRNYSLNPDWNYRAGAEFDEFINDFRSRKPLKVKYYLLNKDIKNNIGNCEIQVIDSNAYISNDYERKVLLVSEKLKSKVLSNILYVKTVDTGSMNGRTGLYPIEEAFNVDGIYVSKATYRTSPIHLFLSPELSIEDQLLLKDYFNLMLEFFREKLDSEFMTTYKYSEADYTRKYLGLNQVRKLIETFPIRDLNGKQRDSFERMIKSKQPGDILKYLRNIKKEKIKKDPNTLAHWF